MELHPLDVTPAKLDELKSIGVNRISMGVQSLDDATLRAMGRGYTADDAAHAFALVKSRFDNAGIDLILGYPGDPTTTNAEALLAPLSNWGLRHCSLYSLQNERGLKDVPDDNVVLDGIRSASRFLESIGLSRYEISNYAAPGFECRHNLAVWRGEDYIGLGDGAARTDASGLSARAGQRAAMRQAKFHLRRTSRNGQSSAFVRARDSTRRASRNGFRRSSDSSTKDCSSNSTVTASTASPSAGRKSATTYSRKSSETRQCRRGGQWNHWEQPPRKPHKTPAPALMFRARLSPRRLSTVADGSSI